MRDRLVERFLRYAKQNTMADIKSTSCPSSAGQYEFAKLLKVECEEIGLKDVTLDQNGYVMATLPSNVDEKLPIIGFIAHMDTAPDYSGENVNPQIVQYNGGDILLNKDLKISIKEDEYEILKSLVGETIITTDGTTLLGADDKLGITEILTAVEYLINNPEIKHGEIKIGFTPDEEIGRGADKFDVEKFGADFAYTVDGGAIGEVECENFNASSVVVEITGLNIHPGAAKDKMVNSIYIGYEFNSMLPKDETPEKTSGYEGFNHLHDLNGTVENTKLYYILRDFYEEGMNKRKEDFKNIEKKLNEKYGEGTIKVTIADQYQNMKELLVGKEYIMDRAKKAMEKVGVVPVEAPIRGGTDGARLSFMGLPCPNLFTGGYNFHGKYEFAVVSYMEKAFKTLIEIMKA